MATFKLTNRSSSSTCFLVAPPPGAGCPHNLVLVVTAAYALEGMAGEECVVVMREKRGEDNFVRREVALPIRSGAKALWVKLPEADVAVITLSVPADVFYKPLRLEELAREEDFIAGKVGLGSECWIFSFPAQLEANEAGLPVLRHGYVASLPLLSPKSSSSYLVDFNTFGGDSGARVLVGSRNGSTKSPLVAGLVVGMQRQTDKTSLPFEERTVHHPLALAIVVPAALIRETVESALK